MTGAAPRDRGLGAHPAAILVLASLLASCGSSGPSSVQLGVLASSQDAFRGQEVRTEGRVRSFRDTSGRYFVIEDAQQDRVEVLPASMIEPYAGRRVVVTGTFEVNEEVGRFIQATQVAPAGP